MKKADRQIIFNKFSGRCAYCGCELEKGWHVDEKEPVRRNYKTIPAHWREGDKHYTSHEIYRMHLSEDQMTERGFKWVESKVVVDGCEHPENFNLDNQMPACASCNINKHSMSIEEFRHLISNFIVSLNRDSTQYKIAKRYGLVREAIKEVVFYFETFEKT